MAPLLGVAGGHFAGIGGGDNLGLSWEQQGRTGASGRRTRLPGNGPKAPRDTWMDGMGQARVNIAQAGGRANDHLRPHSPRKHHLSTGQVENNTTTS